MDANALRQLVPDFATSDVYVCGPKDFNESIVAAATMLGVNRDRIHLEAFSF
jgi:ferredoxin-NADP reductase